MKVQKIFVSGIFEPREKIIFEPKGREIIFELQEFNG
jgi:hypothetical protein